jgi:hypothetical protein
MARGGQGAMNQKVSIIVRLSIVSLSLALAGGCKSQEEKQAEQAAGDLARAQAEAIKAQQQLAEAQQKMQKSVQELGKSGHETAAQGVAAGTAAAAAGMQAAAAAMNSMAGALGKPGAGTAALVDFRVLKELLPESAGGLKRTSATGEKSAAMGMGVSQAEGKYQGEGAARLTVKLIDTSGVGGFALAGMAMAGLEIDKENDDGYERTSTVGGRKIFEKYNNRSKRGEVKVLVANRFVVEVDGDEVPMDAIKELATSKLDLAKLESLASTK